EFSEKRLKGAGRIVGALKIVKGGSFLIVTTIATGGVAAAAGGGMLATAGAAGVVGVGGSLVESGATLLGHVIAGNTGEFSVSDELIKAAKEGAMSFVGGAASKYVSGKFATKMAAKFGAKLTPKLGAKGARL